MSAQRDPELDRIGDEHRWDYQQRELAQYLRATPHPYSHVEPTPQFRLALQRRLMREAWELASRPSPPWYRRLLAPQAMAWTAAAVGAVLIVFVAFFFAAGPRQTDQIDVSVVSQQQNSQLVSTVQPIELTFSQPMDTSSVRVQIQPATQANLQWQGNTLKITPVNGLSANTQYQVTVTSARTAAEKPVARIQPVTFVTGPSPTPVPSAGPTPTPQPNPIVNQRALLATGALPALWSGDGTSLLVVGPGGVLQQYQMQSGTVQKLADGVTLDAIAPDGSTAWVSGGAVTWKSTTISGVQPIALGFRQGALVLATATEVQAADEKRLVQLKETATAAEFSPGGDRLAYLGASGLHLVDLATAKDTLVGPATGLGDWSPTAARYAYRTDGGVWVADAVTGSAARLADLAGVTGVSWSVRNQLLLSTSTPALYLANYTDGSQVTARKVMDGAFAQPDWAPSGTGQFSFVRTGQVWTARVQEALLQGGPLAPAGAAQDQLVNAFMIARQNQLAEQAATFLDATAREEFRSAITLIYSDPSTALARYYVLLSQPGRVVVRMILGTGPVQTAIDETLLIQRDANGDAVIHGVSEQAPRAPFAAGPEVVSVVVSGSQVQVFFDSDLEPGSATQPGSVSIRGASTASQFDPRRRLVTLTIAGGLTPGATYELVIGSGLQDVSKRHAQPYTLQFTG